MTAPINELSSTSSAPTKSANPQLTLRQTLHLPDFANYDPAQVPEALAALIEENKAHIDSLMQTPNIAYGDFMPQMEAMDDSYSKLMGPLSHLHGVANTAAVRATYDACLALATEYGTWLSQHQALYRACKHALADAGNSAIKLSEPQRQALLLQIRDFELSGVGLADAEKATYAELSQTLAKTSSTFSNQLMDATDAWTLHFDNEERLQGLPESSLAQAKQLASSKDQPGYMLNLDASCYMAVLSFAQDQELRREMYQAYSTRASEHGPHAGQFDNGPLLEKLGALRHEKAQLLGFDSYANYSVARKMADSPQQVLDFLHNLANQCRPIAAQELAQLQAFANECGHEGALQPWDVPFYSERLRQDRYAISQEDVKPYLPLPSVLNGLFSVVKRLFDIDVTQFTAEELTQHGISLWHPDVQFFCIRRHDAPVSYFYLDLFAREQKRGGAWMAPCRTKQVLADGSAQLPVAYLVCNFAPATDGKPALLSHSDTVTLFHEFGHGLHHMLTTIDVADVAGIGGVPWDAVELPSQLLENWAWQPEALQDFARHYETNAPLPQELLDKLLAAKHFQSAMFMVRQLEFALFDLTLHHQYDPTQPTPVQQVLDDIRSQVAVVTPPSWNRFQNGFSHIFAGGYAAGYYSYLWADVLAADVFERFIQEGVFNAETGQAFLDQILSQGGSQEAMVLFKHFMGREPDVSALLRARGLEQAT